MRIQRRLQSCLAAGLALSLPLTAVSIMVPQQRHQIAVAANETSQSELVSIKAIDFIQDGDNIRLVVYLAGGNDPQILFTQQDNDWVSTIAEATLTLPDGSQNYVEDNPIAGISRLAATQNDDNSVEIRITGNSDSPPEGVLSNSSADQVMFEFAGLANSDATEVSQAQPLESDPPAIQPDEVLASSIPGTDSESVEFEAPDADDDAPLATSEVSDAPLTDITELRSDIEQPDSQESEVQASLDPSPEPFQSSPPPIETAANPAPISPTTQESATVLENGLLSPIDTYLNQSGASSASPSNAATAISAAPAQGIDSPNNNEAEPGDSDGEIVASSPTTDPRVPTPIPENSATPELNVTAAAAPPIGDIVTGDIVLTNPAVELGSREQVTLTLKDAPVADVLSLLVRRAGLDVVLNDVPAGSTISLDVADSPLQTVFNSVLRLNELQAERVGRTLFIGSTLPGVQQETLRTFRLNQAYVNDTTLEFGGITPSIGESNIVDGEDIEVVGILGSLEDLAGEGGPFEGVSFYGDDRTNSITAVGTPNQLDLVGAKIAQLDIRKRQAVIDFKLIDFIVGDEFTLETEGFAGLGNFGVGVGSSNEPADLFDASTGDPGQDGILDSRPVVEGPEGLSFSFDNLLNNFTDPFGTLDIQALIETTRSKLLADPKVLVSDGGFTTVAIGDEVVTNIEITTDPATLLTTETAVIGNAGVSLSVRNVRIDDNGYVSLDLSPQVSSPASTQLLGDTTITLLSQRTLNTQQIRLRDGQTFVLSGLIQDTDLVTVQKVPILGDIPLLGALFRDENTDNTRREAVLLMTPHIVKDS